MTSRTRSGRRDGMASRSSTRRQWTSSIAVQVPRTRPCRMEKVGPTASSAPRRPTSASSGCPLLLR
jgi:hypothetical protein